MERPGNKAADKSAKHCFFSVFNMKRVGRSHGLLSSIPSVIRYNSTESRTPTVRRIVRFARLEDVLIPSVKEIQEKNAAANPSYTSNISYLQNASDNSLSARLARLGLTETAQQGPARPTVSVRASMPEDITALTARTRVAREARNTQIPMRNDVPVLEKPRVLRAEPEKAAAFISPGRTTEKFAADAAAKRRAERLHRQSQSHVGTEGQESTQSFRPSRPSNRYKERTVAPRATARKPQTSLQTVRKPQTSLRTVKGQSHSVDIDEAVFQSRGHEPEYKGPEQLSSNLLDHFGSPFDVGDVVVTADSGKSVKVPISKIGSFVRGDYTPYVTVSTEDFVTPPGVLGPVKVAQRTLSHQRHFSLPARDGIIKVFSQFAQPSSKTAAEAR